MTQQDDAARFAVLIECLCRLQESKERVYGVDWKRFGLVSSMFNMFRKFIRLRTMWEGGWQPPDDDSRLDTLIDLHNYVVLCITLHAEMAPAAFTQFLATLPHARALSPTDFPSDHRGFQRFLKDVLLPDQSLATPTPALRDAITKLLPLGQDTIETWLSWMAQLAQAEDNGHDPRASASASSPSVPLADPHARLAHLYQMIRLCVAAILRQSYDAPEEWDAFVARYGRAHG